MSVVLLPGDVLRVPTVDTLPDGAKVHGTRDLQPGDPGYEMWLPWAEPEEEQRGEDPDDAAILARWRDAASA
ncbi:hypothetical protein ACIBO2_05110 [Nonomuraea sp. NPDC050022]|uniref:hypothetical protein n=1 Tax=unclassified Nonomuraea TaxID=2593643 RepID=UPI0033DE53FE